MYSKPKGRTLEEYVQTLTNVIHDYKNVIIIGDLNRNILTESYESKHLRDVTESLSLHMIPSEATYDTCHLDSCRDVIIVDSLSKVTIFVKSDEPFINGLHLLELTYTFRVLDFGVRMIFRRNYRRFNEEDYLPMFTYELSARSTHTPA